MRLSTLATTLLASVVLLNSAIASTEPPETPVGERLALFMSWFDGEPLAEPQEVFTAAFLEQVPPSKIIGLTASLRQGPFRNGIELIEIESGATDHKLRALVKGVDSHFRVYIEIDPDTMLINGLLLRPATDIDAPTPASWAAFDALLTALPGQTNLGVYELTTDGIKPIHELNPASRLAIGSAFKLWVLGALAEEIHAGNHAWSDMLAIDDAKKSLPSGTFQNLPHGTERTLAQFALNMISISDNTATDHLIDLLGRERVETYMTRLHDKPAINTPFLKTMDMFTIKLSGDVPLRDSYIKGSEDERRAMLAPGGAADVAEPNIILVGTWSSYGKPIEIDTLEWFATPGELARVMKDLARLESLDGMQELTTALTTNPGIAFNPKRWKTIAFKGGSEVGVINLTFRPTTLDGRTFILSLGWNNPDKKIDEQAFVAMADQAVRLLERAFPSTQGH